MIEQVFEFKKSDHFMHSQWNRKIPDSMLRKVLPKVESTSNLKSTAIVLPSFLSKKNFQMDTNRCLILIHKSKVLITAYWCSDPNYLFNKGEQTKFQIIY
jgi:hypothetical protein